MKLEVGQFVRTPYGIRKIVNITKDDGYGKPRVKVIKLNGFLNTGYKFNNEFYTDEKIIKECKSSFNIIDILEVGDYVNGYKVEEVNNNLKEHKGICNSLDTYLWAVNDLDEFEEIVIFENDIKSVITHEQFKQMEYKVGE